MSEQKSTPIGALGEFGLIDRLTDGLTALNSSTVKSIGDDAAVLDMGKLCSVISTDLLIEGIHFDLSYTPLKHLGYKAVMVNLSDIYAMNAVATQITVSLGVSNRFSVEAIEKIYEGVKTAAEEYGVDIVGGDTTSSISGLVISITAIGQAKKEDLVYRNGAKVGDLICVTGDLGSAYLGLQLLEREKQIYLENPEIQPDLENQTYLVQRQLKPHARRDLGINLNTLGIKCSSMIDVSDGLSSDLMHIAKQSEVGAKIVEDWVPIHEEAKLMALKFQMDPVTCALNGGEDYELLFTIDRKHEEDLHDVDDITVIGEVMEASYGIKLVTSSGNEHEMLAQGWKHFGDEK